MHLGPHAQYLVSLKLLTPSHQQLVNIYDSRWGWDVLCSSYVTSLKAAVRLQLWRTTRTFIRLPLECSSNFASAHRLCRKALSRMSLPQEHRYGIALMEFLGDTHLTHSLGTYKQTGLQRENSSCPAHSVMTCHRGSIFENYLVSQEMFHSQDPQNT